MSKELFLNPETKELRSGWQVLAFTLLFIFFAVLGAVLESLLPLAPLQDAPLGLTLIFLVRSSLELLAAILASLACVIGLTRRSINSLGLALHRGWFRDFAIGLLIATLMIVAIVSLQTMIGGTAFKWQPPTSALPLLALPTLFILLLIAASYEEVLFRGFPLQTLSWGINPIAASLLMSVPFGLGHLGNPNVSIFSTINTILAGLWLCLAYFKTRSLWLPIGLHLGWNFTMGALFGLPVSGVTLFSMYAPFQSTSIKYEWFTGGNYGPEGGFSATLLLIIGMLWLYWSNWFKVSPEMTQANQNDQQPPPQVQ